MLAKPTTLDGYLAQVEGEKRVALQRLRKTLRSIVPDAEECISYGIPAFRLPGGVVAGFCATTKGCSYFPFSGTTLGTLAREVSDYSQTKSALHFSPAAPLPVALIRKLVAARKAEMTAPRALKKAAAGRAKKPPGSPGAARRTRRTVPKAAKGPRRGSARASRG
jgi:uncharacterized protein YdhG (YjbR/CyaY superfamily)